MPIKDAVISMIEKASPYPCLAANNAHLYRDCGFDSLAFTALLVEIEEAFSVSFELTEMQSCLLIGELIGAVEKKLEGRGQANDQEFVAE